MVSQGPVAEAFQILAEPQFEGEGVASVGIRQPFGLRRQRGFITVFFLRPLPSGGHGILQYQGQDRVMPTTFHPVDGPHFQVLPHVLRHRGIGGLIFEHKG